ncbi:NYN domain-containing protein [Myxosarcina sp. GI1]|uniref:NYN domain-containing protein n=1 Tax=Myxosarcina sp. GI1 TaxID=1541065 RepID=UPI000567D7E1|nr:NYN domain-containing protein [Myxosarcina sp. GI1]
MLSSPYQALLLVDGYNIIGHWSDLKKSRDRDGLEVARDRLIEHLINYAAVVTYRTKIVFDAHYQKNPRTSEEYSSLLSVHYTGYAETADTYIEKFCAAFQRNKYQQPCSRLIVATSDRAQQLTVVGYGAEWRSARVLAGEVAAAAYQTKKRKQTSKKSSRRFLFNTLDPIAQQRLKQWQRGIY